MPARFRLRRGTETDRRQSRISCHAYSCMSRFNPSHGFAVGRVAEGWVPWGCIPKDAPVPVHMRLRHRSPVASPTVTVVVLPALCDAAGG